MLRRRAHWVGVALDAPDGPALAHFYARLLDWEIATESRPWTTLAPRDREGYNLAFMTEDRYQRPVWPAVDGSPQMSMHLDLEIDDLAEAEAHAVGCGAELASYQPQDDVRVMLDPAGHPFCLYLGRDEPGTPSSGT